MKILQFCPTLSYGDAIGNEVLYMKRIISVLGYETEVYCEFVHPPYTENHAKTFENLVGIEINTDDIVILHLSTESRLNEVFENMNCRKVIRYHNITPPCFFEFYNPSYSEINRWALQDAAKLARVVDYCFAASDFNKSDLISMGYNCKIDTMPILIDYSTYRNKSVQSILSQYNDDYVNILFVGRMAPNKKVENVIKVFKLYQKHFNEKSRLFLVGSYNNEDKYYIILKNYIDLLKVHNVIFTGHIKLEAVLTYYHLADIFLCMSEHEGFCVPLVEAMFFGVPIVAYDKCAVKDTLGDSGFLISEKTPLIFAEAIDYIHRHPEWKERMIAGQKCRLDDFDSRRTVRQFSVLLDNFINSPK
ncbi:MAG: glycosyltransferase family 4 protein [Bacteroidales bacterium]|jgi:glycosyltransferase involved in cell wall biosynthesis|nr:glycosyltransferase family 4 protein [Bacteroidales bacterium]